LHELTLVRDVCRILEKPPVGKPETLVEAMINVAITGLYVSTVQEGLRRHDWQEPQLVVIQAQLEKVRLLPFVAEAFREEQVHCIYIAPPANFKRVMGYNQRVFNQSRSFKETLRFNFYTLMPEGWVFQNMKVTTELHQSLIDCIDPANEQMFPAKIEKANAGMVKTLSQNSVFHLLADIAIPNYVKANQTAAFNQTLANQAQIACALERYHLVHGEYPETLDVLAPQFMKKIPHDIIGGQPLKYRRTPDGKFLLYSVGWNETDDGGQVALKKGGSVDQEKGDWVWQYPAK
jgi:hypothetical protein